MRTPEHATFDYRGPCLAALCTLWATCTHAQTPADVADTPVVHYDLSGPRIGVTFRPEGDTRQVGRFVSQFGWHFENQVVGRSGPAFLIEVVPLVSGVEYGQFQPSLSLAFGVRTRSRYEFGIGPTVSIGPSPTGTGLRSALFVAAGRSFDFDGVQVPLNVAVTAGRNATRLSLFVGYAVRQTSRVVGTQETFGGGP